MSQSRLEEILAQIKDECAGDEETFNFLKTILFAEDGKGKGWWYSSTYSEEIGKNAKEWVETNDI